MIIGQLVQATTSRYIPTTATAIFAGQALTRANTAVTSTAGAPTTLGIAQADLPAFQTGPQANGIYFNGNRTLNVATTGRLAIRVAAGQFAGLAVGTGFGISAGDAVVIGVASTVAATTINGDLLIVDEKVMGADGIGYILVFFN